MAVEKDMTMEVEVRDMVEENRKEAMVMDHMETTLAINTKLTTTKKKKLNLLESE